MTAKLIGQNIDLHVAANETGLKTVLKQEVVDGPEIKIKSSFAPSHLAGNAQSHPAVLNIIPSKSSMLTSSSLRALNLSIHQVGNTQSKAKPIAFIDFLMSRVRRTKSNSDGLGCSRNIRTRKNGCLTWAAFLG